MKRIYSLFICAIAILSMALSSYAASTLTRLESISAIDENAEYVLGIQGTGMHSSGTSGWGVCSNLETEWLKYKLVKAADGNSFKAYTTVSGKTYYLQIPTSNGFTMATAATGANTDIVIGTSFNDTDKAYAVANKTDTGRHLRRNGESGIRSYGNKTGTIVFFYKLTTEAGASISAPTTLDLGATFEGTALDSKTINVGATGLSSPVSYSWANGGVFSAEGTLTNQGGTLTISLIPTAAGNYSDNLVLSATGAQSVSVTVTATINGLTAVTINPVSPAHTIDVTSIGTGFVPGSGVYQTNPLTFTFDKGGNTGSSPTVNATAKDFRSYAKNTIKIATAGNNMKKIVFFISANGKKRLTDIAASTGSVTVDASDWTVTWTGDAAEVTFTVGEKATYGTDGADKAGQFCFNYIDVFDTVADVTPTINAPASLALGSAVVGTTAPSNTLTVSGLYLTEGIEVDWLDGDVFSATPTSLGETGGTLTVTLLPTAVGNYTDHIILSSTGAEDVSIEVTASIVNLDGTGNGTLDSPYDVTRALSIITNGLQKTDNVYVSGVITAVTSVDTGTYGNATYNIAVNGTSGAVLTVYRGYYSNNAENKKFTSADQIKVGDEVVICGKLILYGTDTPEIAANNYIVTLNGNSTEPTVAQKTDVTLTWSQSSVTATVGDAVTLPTLSVSPSEATSAVVINSSNTALATVTDGVVSLVAGATGTAVITAAISGSDAYNDATVSYTLTINAASSTDPEPSTGDWTLVTDASQIDAAGSYIFVFKEADHNYALSSYNNDKDRNFVTDKVTLGDNTASFTDEGVYVFTAETDGTNLYLVDKDGKYIGHTKGTNATDGGKTAITFEKQDDGTFGVKLDSRYLVKNGNNIRCYTAIGTYLAPFIYKQGSDAPVTPTAPTVTFNPAAGAVVSGTEVALSTPAEAIIYWSYTENGEYGVYSAENKPVIDADHLSVWAYSKITVEGIEYSSTPVSATYTLKVAIVKPAAAAVGETYTLVTSAAEITEGGKYILAFPKNTAGLAVGSFDSGNKRRTSVAAVEYNDDKTIATVTDAGLSTFAIYKVGDKIKFIDNTVDSDIWLGNSGSVNDVTSSETPLTVTFNTAANNYTVSLYKATGYRFLLNASGTNAYVKFYASSNEGNSGYYNAAIYRLSGTAEGVVPTLAVSPEAGEVEAGTKVTITATPAAQTNIYWSYTENGEYNVYSTSNQPEIKEGQLTVWYYGVSKIDSTKQSAKASVTYTLKEEEPEAPEETNTYLKVTDASDFIAGEKYILVFGSVGMTGTVDNSKFPTTSEGLSFEGNKAYVSSTSAIAEVELEESETAGQWYIKIGDKYLHYNTGSSSNNVSLTANTSFSKELKFTLQDDYTVKVDLVDNERSGGRELLKNDGTGKVGAYVSQNGYTRPTFYRLTDLPALQFALKTGSDVVAGGKIVINILDSKVANVNVKLNGEPDSGEDYNIDEGQKTLEITLNGEAGTDVAVTAVAMDEDDAELGTFTATYRLIAPLTYRQVLSFEDFDIDGSYILVYSKPDGTNYAMGLKSKQNTSRFDSLSDGVSVSYNTAEIDADKNNLVSHIRFEKVAAAPAAAPRRAEGGEEVYDDNTKFYILVDGKYLVSSNNDSPDLSLADAPDAQLSPVYIRFEDGKNNAIMPFVYSYDNAKDVDGDKVEDNPSGTFNNPRGLRYNDSATQDYWGAYSAIATGQVRARLFIQAEIDYTHFANIREYVEYVDANVSTLPNVLPESSTAPAAAPRRAMGESNPVIADTRYYAIDSDMTVTRVANVYGYGYDIFVVDETGGLMLYEEYDDEDDDLVNFNYTSSFKEGDVLHGIYGQIDCTPMGVSRLKLHKDAETVTDRDTQGAIAVETVDVKVDDIADNANNIDFNARPMRLNYVDANFDDYKDSSLPGDLEETKYSDADFLFTDGTDIRSTGDNTLRIVMRHWDFAENLANQGITNSITIQMLSSLNQTNAPRPVNVVRRDGSIESLKLLYHLEGVPYNNMESTMFYVLSAEQVEAVLDKPFFGKDDISVPNGLYDIYLFHDLGDLVNIYYTLSTSKSEAVDPTTATLYDGNKFRVNVKETPYVNAVAVLNPMKANGAAYWQPAYASPASLWSSAVQAPVRRAEGTVATARSAVANWDENTVTGLDEVSANDVNITVVSGGIRVTGYNGLLRVFTLSGIQLVNVVVDGDTYVELPDGFVMVVTEPLTVKALVK